MLSKTAMALLPAASLVGSAALALTTSLAHSGEKYGFVAVDDPDARDSECREDLLRTSAPRSVAKVCKWFTRSASSLLQKKLNRAG